MKRKKLTQMVGVRVTPLIKAEAELILADQNKSISDFLREQLENLVDGQK